jgi:MFS family permease
MSLMMLSKGSTVETLGLITSIYSIFIVAFEFPSGVLSDKIGQKKIYLFSLALSIIGYSIVLLTSNLLWLFIGFAFYGISRAFSSGSVEALFINQYINDHGKDSLHQFMSAMNTGETLGLATGALLGGVIPLTWEQAFPSQNKYNGNLVIQIIVLIVLFFISLALVTDPHIRIHKNISMWRHIRKSLSVVAQNRNLILLILGTMIWGFCFNAVELYWQPQVKSILGGESKTWIFGIINSAYFFAALIGVGIINLILGNRNRRPNIILFVGRLSIGLLIILLSFQSSILLFSSVYLSLFMVNGMMNIPEGTLLNTLIPDENRSSLLSLASLMMQMGGITGSLTFSALVGTMKIGGVWGLSGVVFVLSGLLFLGIGTSTKVEQKDLGPL